MSLARVTRQAQADLEEVWTVVAQAGEYKADALLDRILQQCKQLAQFPKIGRERNNLAPNLRSFAVSPFVIFFRPSEDGVEIVRVLDGRRSFEGIFEGE